MPTWLTVLSLAISLFAIVWFSYLNITQARIVYVFWKTSRRLPRTHSLIIATRTPLIVISIEILASTLWSIPINLTRTFAVVFLSMLGLTTLFSFISYFTDPDNPFQIPKVK